MIKVSVKKQLGGSLEVEWVDDGGQVNKAMVPAKAVVDGYADVRVLNSGIQLGLPWEFILPSVTVDADTLAQVFRKVGIWTEADATSQNVYTALQMALGVDVSSILNAIRLYSKEMKYGK